MPPGRSFSSRAAASRARSAGADPSKPTTAYTCVSGDPVRVPAVCSGLVASVNMTSSFARCRPVELANTTLSLRVVLCNLNEGAMTRETALEDLYHGLTTMARRARDMSDELHPALSLVAYTLLTEIDLTPGTRAADLCAHFGLDKSTLSRQLDQ